jgi:hypothetical protein
MTGHVEGGSHWGAPAGDRLAAALRAAVAIEGSDADEACDFTPIEAPELRQFGMRVGRVALPTRGTLAKRSASACQAGLFRIAPSMSRSSSESSA